jgi:adenylate cyclase
METTVPRPENLEIERKFLVDPSYVATLDEGRNIVQGYLVSRGPVSVRVRLVPSADIYMLTVKGPRRDDMRIEEEQQLRKSVAEMLLAACGSRVIEKVRYLVTSDRDLKPWVVDVFHGQNNGLVIAEIELDNPEESFEVPSWATKEVTLDERYYNEYLADHPFATW